YDPKALCAEGICLSMIGADQPRFMGTRIVRAASGATVFASSPNDASAPHLIGDLDHHAQLRPLLFFGQHIALFGGREAALRRQTKLIEGGELGRFLDAALDVVFLF